LTTSCRFPSSVRKSWTRSLPCYWQGPGSPWSCRQAASRLLGLLRSTGKLPISLGARPASSQINWRKGFLCRTSPVTQLAVDQVLRWWIGALSWNSWYAIFFRKIDLTLSTSWYSTFLSSCIGSPFTIINFHCYKGNGIFRYFSAKLTEISSPVIANFHHI